MMPTNNPPLASVRARELLAEALRDDGYESDADYIEHHDPEMEVIDYRSALRAIDTAAALRARAQMEEDHAV